MCDNQDGLNVKGTSVVLDHRVAPTASCGGGRGRAAVVGKQAGEAHCTLWFCSAHLASLQMGLGAPEHNTPLPTLLSQVGNTPRFHTVSSERRRIQRCCPWLSPGQERGAKMPSPRSQLALGHTLASPSPPWVYGG